MEQYKIKGGRRIGGSIKAAGAKNAALPILAASLLIEDECLIEGCPAISDVEKMKYIIGSIGGRIREEDGGLLVDARQIGDNGISRELSESMRSSVFTAGPLLARRGHAELYRPGGCKIGTRPIDLHLSVLSALGAEILCEKERIVCTVGKGGLTGAEISLPFPSVGATENALCAAACAHGRTVLMGAAREPEIVDLARFLNRCGAQISGAGSEKIEIEGVTALHGSRHRIVSDRIEGGTFLLAAAMTGGHLFLADADAAQMESLLFVLKQAGCRITVSEDGIELAAPERLHSVELIKTAPYPGFPTDMQSQMTAALALADGTSQIEETIFENRFGVVKELRKMGAQIEICGKSAIINGTEVLKGKPLTASDLRGGAALVLSALAAEGESTVAGVEHIDRGYDRFEERLCLLGARIERMPIEIENPSEKDWRQNGRRKDSEKKEEKKKKELPAQDHCLPAFMCTAVSSPESGIF